MIQHYHHLLGIPLPLPLIALCAAPGGNPRCGACGCSDSWFPAVKVSNNFHLTIKNHYNFNKSRENALTNSLIHTQNQTGRLRRRLHRIYLHQTWLPNKRLHIIPYTLIIKVHARPCVPFSVLDTQLGKDVCGVEAGVVAELAGDYFEGFGEGFDYRLLFAGDGEVGGAVEVRGDFHLWEVAG